MDEEFKNYIQSIHIDEPIIIYNLNILKNNIQKILELSNKYNIQFMFPVKSFPNKKIIQIFKEYNFGFDIANFNELSIISDIINNKTLVSCTGPYLGSLINLKKIKLKKVIFNANSIYQLNHKTNGIRLNITKNSNFQNFSHFGMEDILNNKDKLLNIESIHIHLDNISYKKKIKLIEQNIDKILTKFPNLKYFNIGGCWEIDFNFLENLFQQLRLKIPYNIKILIEIGENWTNNIGYLITKVIDINQIKDKKIIYVNASKDCHAKWSQLKLWQVEKTSCREKSIFCGMSCYEKDILAFSLNYNNFQIGDKVIFQGINGYSYSWLCQFNGSAKAEVIFYEK